MLSFRQRIGKMKLLALHWRTVLNLDLQALTSQVEDRCSVNLPLPDELGMDLSAQG